MNMLKTRARRALAAACCAGLGALTFAGGGAAHAEIGPAIFQAGEGREFVLTVPTEEQNATTTQVELTPPSGFKIFSFGSTPGWKRDVQATGEGEDATVQKVTWSGGSIPSGEYGEFPFTGNSDESGTYAFQVRQTYSDGSVVDWTGPEDSDTPAARVEAVSELGGGGSSSTLAIVALIVAGVALLLGIVGLLAGRGRALA